MLKTIKKPMLKLLIGGMFVSLVPAKIVFADDMVTNSVGTTDAKVNVDGTNITTSAAVNVNAGNTTTGPGVNVNYGDTTAPVFKSISTDKKSATVGDKLTVTVEASDDISGVEYISVSYKAPAGNATKSVLLSKNSEGKYSGTLTVELNDAVGIWKVDTVSLLDNVHNSMYINNSETNIYGSVLKDLSAGDFEVSGTTPDITPPVFKGISMDKTTVSKGEKITATVEASDDISGVEYISISYKAPEGNATKSVLLSKNSEGKYSGTLTVGLNDAVGIWKVDTVSLLDNAHNSIYINNSETNIYGSVLKDLSTGDFEVNSTVVNPTVTPEPSKEPDPELTPDIPTNIVELPTSVRILGNGKVGNTLSAEIRKKGTVFAADSSANIVYEWFRLDKHSSKNGVLVGRDKNYELVDDDFGKYIKLVIYYNNNIVDEDITFRIGRETSGGSSSSSSDHQSSSSSSNNEKTSNNGDTTSNNNTGSSTNSTQAKTIKVEKNEAGVVKLVNVDGQTVTGWQLIDQKWYLADSTGVAQTGWQQVNGNWYLLNNDAVMETGWQQVNGKWYLLKDDGSMATGWQETNGKWYYLYSDGSMASDTTIDGYRVDDSGAWV